MGCLLVGTLGLLMPIGFRAGGGCLPRVLCSELPVLLVCCPFLNEQFGSRVTGNSTPSCVAWWQVCSADIDVRVDTHRLEVRVGDALHVDRHFRENLTAQRTACRIAAVASAVSPSIVDAFRVSPRRRAHFREWIFPLLLCNASWLLTVCHLQQNIFYFNFFDDVFFQKKHR